MKIHFIGLSCFMIENEAGFRILVDPFNDAPEWSLGLRFPKEFEGKQLGANIVLMTEPDADHAYTPGDFLEHAPATKPNSNPFPGLDLRGTVVYEYNGDINIAYQYTVDALRLLHLADNAHTLTADQVTEIGQVDIVFISPPKTERGNSEALNSVKKNIELLQAKVIVWAHHIVPDDMPTVEDSVTLQNYFKKYFKERASTNKNYQGEESFMQLCYIYENALDLNKEYTAIVSESSSMNINQEFIQNLGNKQISILFKKMLAK